MKIHFGLKKVDTLEFSVIIFINGKRSWELNLHPDDFGTLLTALLLGQGKLPKTSELLVTWDEYHFNKDTQRYQLGPLMKEGRANAA